MKVRSGRARTRLAVATALLGATVVGGVLSPPATASSHREAPLISQDPVADNTDLYAFRDPRDQTKLNIIANYVGLEQPASGPNFNRFGDDVLYEIHIDNNGDVEDDITYQFRFRTIIRRPGTFLYNDGRMDGPGDIDRNVVQTYEVRRIKGGTNTLLGTNLLTSAENVGPRSISGDFETLIAQRAINGLPGGSKVFAGPRKDAFYADLGSLFDLLGIRPAPFNTAHAIDQPAEPARDGLADKNVHTISLQIPLTELTRDGRFPTAVDAKDSVIGIYASSSRRQQRVLSTTGAAPATSGDWVQVSRLGLPLINEVVIPLGQKDRWNAMDPKDDVANFGQFLLDPEPARLIGALYDETYADKSTKVPPGGAANRPDLIKLLTGQFIGLSPGNALAPADLLRVNLARFADTRVQNSPEGRLGALAGDPQGFPNGRRLRDDVVDIELRVLAGLLLGAPYNDGANAFVGDQVNGSDRPYLDGFPYQATPISGFDQDDRAR